MALKLTEPEIQKRVMKVIAEMLQVFNRDVTTSLKGETNINADLGIDSVEMMDLIGALEKEFAVNIEADKAARIKTINDVVKYIMNV